MPPSTAVAPQQQTQLSFPERVIRAVEGTAAFETLLPGVYKPLAPRFLARAKLYIARKPELQQCTVSSLAQCVLSAAQDGLCLDGRMAHAVVFNCKKKDPQTGKETWVKEATYMPDYKGIVDCCRRHGAIVDAMAEHVYSGDVFEFYMENGKYQHKWQRAMGDRGDLLGAFCLLLLPENRFKIEYMSLQEITHVRNKSKAKDSGPWVSDTGEMQKKTVIKRALKLYVTDPDTADLLDRDDAALGYHEDNDTIRVEAPPAKSLADHAARKAIGHTPAQPMQFPERTSDYEMAEAPTFTAQEEDAEVAAIEQERANREAFSKVLFDLTKAPSLTVVSDLERQGGMLVKTNDDTKDLADCVDQAIARIKGTRGEKSNKKAENTLLPGTNEPPDDVLAAMEAEGIH
jgi:phage RecT family recombinase